MIGAGSLKYIASMRLQAGHIASIPMSKLDLRGFTTVETPSDAAVLVYFHEGKPKAVWDLCPHMGAPLSDGALKEGNVRCPWHGYDFDGGDGRMVHNPNDRIFGCMKHLYKTYDASKTPLYRLKMLTCEEREGMLHISSGSLT